MKLRRRAAFPEEPRRGLLGQASNGNLLSKMALMCVLGLSCASARVVDNSFAYREVDAKATKQDYRYLTEVMGIGQPSRPPPPVPPPRATVTAQTPPPYGSIGYGQSPPPASPIANTPSPPPASPINNAQSPPPASPIIVAQSPPPMPPSYGYGSAPPHVPSPPPAPSPPLPPPSSPPPPGVTRLPPLNSGFVMISSNSSGSTTAASSYGLVRVSPQTADNSTTWNYICGDPWAGWDDAAAVVACREAGYTAGGEPLRAWRTGPLPSLLLGKLHCTGKEAQLADCPITGAANKTDAWNFNVDSADSSSVCSMVAGLRCRSGAAAANSTLRAASRPSPSGTTGLDGGNQYYFARLEVSVGTSNVYGAVCRDNGFDNAAATVACRALGRGTTGIIYAAGKGTGTNSANNYDTTMDAEGSYIGAMSGVRCRGTESNLNECASWRAPTAADMQPCKAAAWVACSS